MALSDKSSLTIRILIDFLKQYIGLLVSRWNRINKKDKIDSSINKRIKILRVTNNLNQQEFADKVGISVTTVSSIESNKQSPSYKILRNIQECFKCDKAWLMDGTHENLPSEVAEREIPELILMLLNIGSDEDKILVYTMLKRLLDIE